MSDLIKRDDALRSLEEWYAQTCKPETLQGLADILAGYSAYKDIAKIPAVDAVAVVRCWDCKYWGTPTENQEAICRHWSSYYGSIRTMDYQYCSFGERREDNE